MIYIVSVTQYRVYNNIYFIEEYEYIFIKQTYRNKSLTTNKHFTGQLRLKL